VGWTDEFLEDATVDLGAESMLSRALDSAGPVVVTRRTSDPRLSEPPHLRREARGCVSVAVRGLAGPSGVLSVYTDERGGFTEGDVHFIQAVANVLSSAVGRERSEVERSRLSPRAQEARGEGGSVETDDERQTVGCAGHVG
jgi:GAF domain-containing protein